MQLTASNSCCSDSASPNIFELIHNSKIFQNSIDSLRAELIATSIQILLLDPIDLTIFRKVLQ